MIRCCLRHTRADAKTRERCCKVAGQTKTKGGNRCGLMDPQHFLDLPTTFGPSAQHKTLSGKSLEKNLDVRLKENVNTHTCIHTNSCVSNAGRLLCPRIIPRLKSCFCLSAIWTYTRTSTRTNPPHVTILLET